MFSRLWRRCLSITLLNRSQGTPVFLPVSWCVLRCAALCCSVLQLYCSCVAQHYSFINIWFTHSTLNVPFLKFKSLKKIKSRTLPLPLSFFEIQNLFRDTLESFCAEQFKGQFDDQLAVNSRNVLGAVPKTMPKTPGTTFLSGLDDRPQVGWLWGSNWATFYCCVASSLMSLKGTVLCYSSIPGNRNWQIETADWNMSRWRYRDSTIRVICRVGAWSNELLCLYTQHWIYVRALIYLVSNQSAQALCAPRQCWIDDIARLCFCWYSEHSVAVRKNSESVVHMYYTYTYP